MKNFNDKIKQLKGQHRAQHIYYINDNQKANVLQRPFLDLLSIIIKIKTNILVPFVDLINA